MNAPSVSIVLLTFNQEQFVKEAFLSLLNQDLDNVEIVVSDDCSSDGTWECIGSVAKSYLGPKKIIYSKNTKNLGIVDNFAAAVNIASGDLIFMAAGDDISLPNRCSQSIQFWLDNQQKYDLVAADAFDMEFDGAILGVKKNSDLEHWTVEKWFQRRPYFFGASHMLTRRLLDLATLNNQLPYEDQCLVFRAILMGGAIRLPVPLVCHRRGGMTQAVQFKFAHRRAEIARDMARELLELQQFLSDAIALGKESLVKQLIAKKSAYCHALLRLFQNPVSLISVRIFWGDQALSVSDKRRYLRYYFLYPGLAIAHAVRDFIRLLKGKLTS